MKDEMLKVARATPERQVIALPSIEDLERESKRTGKDLPESARLQYLSAQHRIREAQRQMAKAALSVVNPEAFQKINRERQERVRIANREAADEMAKFFTETCNGGF